MMAFQPMDQDVSAAQEGINIQRFLTKAFGILVFWLVTLIFLKIWAVRGGEVPTIYEGLLKSLTDTTLLCAQIVTGFIVLCISGVIVGGNNKSPIVKEWTAIFAREVGTVVLSFAMLTIAESAARWVFAMPPTGVAWQTYMLVVLGLLVLAFLLLRVR